VACVRGRRGDGREDAKRNCLVSSQNDSYGVRRMGMIRCRPFVGKVMRAKVPSSE
jgi:hypothetical protein